PLTTPPLEANKAVHNVRGQQVPTDHTASLLPPVDPAAIVPLDAAPETSPGRHRIGAPAQAAERHWLPLLSDAQEQGGLKLYQCQLTAARMWEPRRSGA